ncbi:pentapeptide repeat-containing protein [Streptomyces sp. NPDC053086]|uniref:pentapeptide repeat-containing protein n=1 Tax=unclassified Streptomyces TaxID=2593676 RepID=UPI0037D7634B
MTAIFAVIFTGISVRQAIRQTSLSEQKQITDRYTAATSQLGSSDADARLGAIYALERLMRDSPPDRSTIIQVLSAYVRDHAAPAPATCPTPRSQFTEKTPPALDVQAALSVLGRRYNASEGKVDIGRVSFVNVDLRDAKLIGVDLSRSCMTDAWLLGADMHGSVINLSSLDGANLSEANLSGDEITGSSIKNADLACVNLQGADLSASDLSGSRMLGADLRGADLNSASLDGVALFDVKVDSKTRLPRGTRLQKHGYKC